MRAGLLIVGVLAAGLSLGGCKKKPAEDVSTLPPPQASSNEPMPSSMSAAPQPATPPTDASASTANPAPAGARTHVVKRGETLYSIARAEYGDAKKMKDIAKANGITDPNKIKVGQVLTLP